MQFDSKSVSLARPPLSPPPLRWPLFASAAPAPTPQFTAEKCYGVAAASQKRLSDCGALLCRRIQAGSGREFLGLRSGRHLHEDRRRQPQEGPDRKDRARPRS